MLYSPLLYQSDRPLDVLSYTGVKVGVGLPDLPNMARTGTEGSILYTWDRPPRPVSDPINNILSHNNRLRAISSIA